MARDLLRVAIAVLARPRLWPTAWRQARQLAAPGWWRTAPFLPLPPREYVEFRTLTHYGDAEHPIAPRDVLNYLAWCRSWQRRSETA